MTVNDWTIVISALTTSVMAGFTAFTVWWDRRDKRLAEQKMAELALAREEAEAAHRRKMEELQMVAIRQGGQAAKEAKKAQEAALSSKREVTQKIEASQAERRDQMAKVIDINTAALEAANGVNDKIRSLGEDISARQSSPPIAP